MYSLHKLGWYGFQELCLTIAREILGQTTMSFLSSNDAGQDGSFTGIWENMNGERFEGVFVIQCKHTSKTDYNIKFSDLKDEFEKCKKLAENGECDVYIIMTNAGVSGRLKSRIKAELSVIGISHVLIFGDTWINQIIQENRKLRSLVPRVYGLGDLSQILDERVYRQGMLILDSLKEELGKVVITDAYRKATKSLNDHSFVLIIGEPASGKTTIASMLAMGALDLWGTRIMKLDSPRIVIEHWNPEDPNQFFWIDDAFGVTQYERSLALEWNHSLLHVKAMLKYGAKIVMTSRDYIYSKARNDLKESVFPLLNESQVVIDIQNLTLEEKKQILYNHIKMGNQPKIFRSKIKPFLDYISNLTGFIPETARRLGTKYFTENLYLNDYHLKHFVNKQEAFLLEVIIGLDLDNQAALALIYMNNDKLIAPVDLKEHELNAIHKMGSSEGGCSNALNALNGSLVKISQDEEFMYWKFKHPTIGDSFSIFVTQNPELIEVYLIGTPVDKLLDQITCGNVGLEKAVVIPKQFYKLILDRIKSFNHTSDYKNEYLAKWGAKDKLYSFLAFRCSKEFLVLYIRENEEILLETTTPGLMLEYAPEIELAYSLYSKNLLPEDNRILFVKTISEYSISGSDFFALKSEKIKSIFNAQEFEQLILEIKNKLIPNLHDATYSFKEGFDSHEDPGDFMQPLLESYQILIDLYENEPDIKLDVEREINRVYEWIAENEMESKEIIPREKFITSDGNLAHITNRSIFDDIDI